MPAVAHTVAVDDTVAEEEGAVRTRVANTTAAAAAAEEEGGVVANRHRHHNHSPVDASNCCLGFDAHHHGHAVAPTRRDECLREQVSTRTSWATKS